MPQRNYLAQIPFMVSVASIAIFVAVIPASAQTTIIASDNAANYGSVAQLTTQNNGTGFAGAFTASGAGGFFLGDSTVNGFGDGPGIDSAGVPANRSAFGIYSGGGSGSETVQRTLSAPLTAGSTIRLGFDNGFIDNGFNQVGFGTAGNNTLVEFGFLGGTSDYLFNFNSSTLGYTSGGLNVAFTLNTATTYTLTATRLNDSASYSITGTIAPGTNIDTITFLNSDSTTNPQHDFYVNNLSVIQPVASVAAPEPSSFVLVFAAMSTVSGSVLLRRRK